MQLAFLGFEAVPDFTHRGRLLSAVGVDGVQGKFVRIRDDMNQPTTAHGDSNTIRMQNTFDLVTGVGQRQGTGVERSFLFNFAIDNIMNRTVYQCPADIILAPADAS
ncbi:hypothetical protein RB195_017181 [Necator americanus]|uniref:Uncharacterized protein n=1 Tax=Necator americanus TaxID=51031 RepID=A0ABR1C5J8_NECAM